MNRDIMKVKLGDIIGKVISGEWGEEDINNSGIYVIRTTNFTNNGTINFDNIIKRKINKHNISSKFLLKGDIIIEKSGGSNNQPVGRVVFFDYKENTYLFNNFTGLLRIRDNNKWHHKFVFYKLFNNWQIGNTKFFENKTTGIRNLKLDNYISSIEIPLLPIEEQKKIANILDKVTSLISLRKEQLKKLDELIKSRFIEMFGDIQHNKLFCNTNLDNICHINPPKKKYNDIEVSFIPMSAVSEKGQINTSNIKQYQEVKTGYTHFLENDVLFAKITPCMENGKGAIAKKLKNGIGFGSTEFHILRPIKDVTISEWIYHLTCLEEFRLEATLNMTGSAGQKRVPEFFLKNFKVILPPLELQNKFASFVEEVEKNKEKVNNSLSKLNILKEALMQKYFEDV